MDTLVNLEMETVLRVFDSDGKCEEYSNVCHANEALDGALAASVLTKNGSLIRFEDTICRETESIMVGRKVSVIESGNGDSGFATEIRFIWPFSDPDAKTASFKERFSVFAPGMIYAKNEGTVSNAIGSDLNIPAQYYRTTRLALPYTQLYSDRTGNGISVFAVDPIPDTGIREYNEAYLCHDSLKYASLGLLTEGAPAIACSFPGREGPVNYVSCKNEMIERAQPVISGTTQKYTFKIHFFKAEDRIEALRKEWRYWYAAAKPRIRRCDLKKVYKDGVDLIFTYCQEYNGAMGIPFWTMVPEGHVCDISFQMGFVGQQPQCGYHLLRSGYMLRQEGDPRGTERIRKGKAIADFWVNKAKGSDVLPHVWYEVFPAEFRKGYPSYTRTLADGMEGILNCYLVASRAGEQYPDWLSFCTGYADWLCAHQNSDGSVYRAYEHDGTPAHRGKYNTTNIIRFLAELYTCTGIEAYKECAIRAGEFCYENVFLGMHYIGGTADNDNTIDKEAGMLSLYAFLALYDLTHEDKWLQAACGAADFAETWTYCQEFPVKPAKGSAVFDRSGITGLSFIATGHSHSDVMMAYCAYDYWRLSLLTGDRHYHDFAKLLLHQARQTTDWSGQLGYAYPGLVEESGELARLYHNGLGKWLPWCTIAEIETLSRFEEFFGTMEIDEINEKEALEHLKRGDVNYSGFMRV